MKINPKPNDLAWIESSIADIKQFLLELQNQICHVLEVEDTEQCFLEDHWSYKEGGGGVTKVMTNGKVIEKAGVNFSHIKGSQLPGSASARMPHFKNAPFEALGDSVVVHPLNPYLPTAHMNVRFIVVMTKEGPYWWFGGGFDLTPYYGFEEDCVLWHKHAKEACDVLGNGYYLRFKKWADDYFFLKHRQEARGIGGIFFDDFNECDFEVCFAFMRAVGKHFISAYQTILQCRKNSAFTNIERDFQLYRRGRYVEFNLLYDRGTLFGLQSNGRTESILMSLPPLVTWQYDWHPEIGSEEAKLYDYFLQKKDWL